MKEKQNVLRTLQKVNMDIQKRAENVILHEALNNPGEIHQLMDKIEEYMFIDPLNKLIFQSI